MAVPRYVLVLQLSENKEDGEVIREEQIVSDYREPLQEILEAVKDGCLQGEAILASKNIIQGDFDKK